MSLQAMEVLAIVVGLVVTAVAPAVGWLIHVVMAHDRKIAALEASTSGVAKQIEAHVARVDEMHRNTSGQLHDIRDDIKTLSGDIKALCERTDGLQRTSDRHERFLDAGRMDRS